MSRSAMRFFLLIATVIAISSAMWANPAPVSNVYVTGTVWRVSGNMVDAPKTDPTGGDVIAEGTFTANKIDFWASDPQTSSFTLGNFLSYGGANTAGITGGLTDLMSNCFTQSSSTQFDTHGHPCYSTIIKVEGNTTFLKGQTYTLRHDDGANMFAGGTWVINSAAPTSPTDSTWGPLGSNVSGPFTIYYSGTNGNPEQLKLTGAVPDGGTTVMLLGCVLCGVEALRRRLRA